VIKGHSEAELKELLDAIQCAMLAALKVPGPDHCQIGYEHPAAEMRIDDTGLAFRAPNTVSWCK
jgi:hypothetical protein